MFDPTNLILFFLMYVASENIIFKISSLHYKMGKDFDTKDQGYKTKIDGFVHSLEGVRGFKGDIKFGAKLGKVLWGNMTAETQKKIWDFHDIRDIVVKERGVVPLFNGV